MPQYFAKEPLQYNGYTIGVERLGAIIDEARPLHQKHWEETEVLYVPDETMRPDYDAYAMMEAHGRVVYFTLRGPEGALVGNLLYFVSSSMHYEGAREACEDAFYILPEHRNGRLAMKMLDYAEDLLKEVLQVKYIAMTDKSPVGGKSLASLFSRKGYKPVAVYYRKKVGE